MGNRFIGFPWSKDHGLIEAGCRSWLREWLRNFHGRKIMASLKRLISRCGPLSFGNFHGRKIMASLKLDTTATKHRISRTFPWSKDHGLIEAQWTSPKRCRTLSFPWSKDHGLIEALLLKHKSNALVRISMVERSWPH